jgi:hypothetical protein
VSFINTHNQDELRGAYARLTKPAHGPLATSAHAIGRGIKKITPSIDLDKRALQHAAHLWVDPDCTWTVDKIADFQESVGLKNMRRDEFGERVAYYSSLLKNADPRLARHIEARIAELEYAYLGDRTSVSHYSELELYQRDVLANAACMAAALANPKLREEAVQRANTTLMKLLPAIAAVFRKVLDPKSEDDIHTNANYMQIQEVPDDTRVPEVPGHLGEWGTTKAAARATDLWEDFNRRVKRVFVITCDSDGDRRVGFWVPDVIEGTKMLPGAPTAYHQKIPQTILVDDLPDMPGPDDTKTKWERYLTDKGDRGFRDDMFISIPILARKRHDAEPIVTALVNVNCGGGHYWPRAYSKEWLLLAAKLASPFLHLAWHSSVIQTAADRGDPGLFGTNPFVPELPKSGPPALPAPEDGGDV